jgi:hypothetical protein
MNDFFDGEWKESGDKNLYTKIKNGETKLRILSKALLGWEGWFQNKPVRFPYDYSITSDEYGTLDKDNYDSSKAKWKQFAVCVVWNYNESCVQYWQFNQKQVREQLMQLAQDSDWGDVTKYDIKIKREGEKMETKYTLIPSNKAPLSDTILAMVHDKSLTVEQFMGDKKNAENVENFRLAVKNTTNDGDIADNIPF